MKSTIIFHAIFIIQLFTFIGCASSNCPIDSTGGKKIWTPVAEFSNIDVSEIKIMNDELYIAGHIGMNQYLYKSTDGEKWSLVMPPEKILPGYLNTVDYYNGKIVCGGRHAPLCVIEKDTLIPISPIIKIAASKMITIERGIFIGSSEYEANSCALFSNDSVTYIHNHLYTYNDNECIYEGGIIRPLGIPKLLKQKNTPNERILIGNVDNYNFVTSFANGAIDCFPNKGLSLKDKECGSLDMIYIEDTLYACTMGRIVYYDNNRGWKTFGDSLPKIQNVYPTTLAIAYDESRHTKYVGTNYTGVLKWKEGKGWESFNEGMTPIWENVYATVSDLIYFKGYLYLTYGSSKRWPSQCTGVIKIKL